MSDLPHFALRVMPMANAEIELARERIAVLMGEAVADTWDAGLDEAIRRLSVLPHHAIIAEQEHFQTEIRQVLYRAKRPASVYRVLFTIRDETPDGPQVWVVHLRHASAAPILSFEARAIEAGIENIP